MDKVTELKDKYKIVSITVDAECRFLFFRFNKKKVQFPVSDVKLLNVVNAKALDELNEWYKEELKIQEKGIENGHRMILEAKDREIESLKAGNKDCWEKLQEKSEEGDREIQELKEENEVRKKKNVDYIGEIQELREQLEKKQELIERQNFEFNEEADRKDFQIADLKAELQKSEKIVSDYKICYKHEQDKCDTLQAELQEAKDKTEVCDLCHTISITCDCGQFKHHQAQAKLHNAYDNLVEDVSNGIVDKVLKHVDMDKAKLKPSKFNWKKMRKVCPNVMEGSHYCGLFDTPSRYCNEAICPRVGTQAKLKPDIEYLAEQVHKAYCQYCIDVKGKEYWTKGDYSLLDDKVKEADRYTVRAICKHLGTPRLTQSVVYRLYSYKSFEQLFATREEAEKLGMEMFPSASQHWEVHEIPVYGGTPRLTVEDIGNAIIKHKEETKDWDFWTIAQAIVNLQGGE